MTISKMISQRVFYFLLLIVVFAVPHKAFCQAIPINKVSLRLVPRDQHAEEVSPKTINMARTRFGYKLLWYSLVKEFDEEAHYPTYKMRADRGIIEIDSLDHKVAFFHPSLWGNGYIRSELALPLWVNPEYLELKGKQKKPFNIGLLNNGRHIIKKAPDVIYDQIIFFQNLYNQYVEGDEVNDALNLRKSEKRGIKKFIREFFYVRKIAKTKSEIYVNLKKESYPSIVFGNEYFQFVAINDPLNPLIINLRILPAKVPKAFRESFKRFKKNFEYRITQISY